MDIDPNAVEITQFSLLLKLIEGETANTLKEYVTRSKTPALPGFETAVICGNSLVSLEGWRTAFGADPTDDWLNPFSWETEFPDEMNRGGFDAIIGNPPYIRIQHTASYSPEEVKFFRHPNSPYSTAEHNNFDKYLLFIERSIELTHSCGRTGMIVPHKFMTIQSGRALRRLIAERRLLSEIVHFGAKQVFGVNAANYTCILILDRKMSEVVRLERPEQLKSWRYGQSGSVDMVPIEQFGEDSWQFADTDTAALFERIRTQFPDRLDTVAEIFVGVQTSADKIYIFKAVAEDEATCTLRWNDQDWLIERELLRPSLLDTSLSQFARPRSNTWIIFPYYFVTDAAGKTATHLIQPDTMKTCYPGCWDYLCARKPELKGRNIVGGHVEQRQWYQYGRSQSLSKFNKNKIILPVLSTEPRYAYDDREVLVTGGGNGPYYLICPRPDALISNHYLLAVLNHPVSEALVRTHTSVFRGGYYSHGKQFIQNLPIPLPDNMTRALIETLVTSLIARLDALAVAHTPRSRMRLDREVDDLKLQVRQHINQVFELTQKDLDIIDAVPIPD